MNRLSLSQVCAIWVLGFGLLSLVAMKRIATWLNRVRLPIVVKYYLLVIPIVLLEEVLTIEVPYFWGVLPILLAFCLFFLILYLFQRVTRCHWIVASGVFGLLGWVNEFLLVGRISQMDVVTLIVMSGLCVFIYAVMAILPSYYLQWALRERRLRNADSGT